MKNRRQALVHGVAGLFVATPWFHAKAATVFENAAGAARPQQAVAEGFALMLGLIRQNEQNAVRAGRGLAYMAAALHRAGQKGADAAGLALCAQRILVHFFPRSDHVMLASWAAAYADVEPSAKTEPGEEAAKRAIARSMNDGAKARWSPSMRPADFKGIWQPAYPMYVVQPVEGMAPSWQPWVEPTARRYSPPTAPRPGSARHEAEVREVMDVAAKLTPEQKVRARWWNLDEGSVTPAGVWVRVALAMTQGMDVQKQLLALRDVTAAMHDANIACWIIKLRDWAERPVTTIRRDYDPNFAPLLVTPGHPSYVSGHATVSGAAAEALVLHLPQHADELRAKAQEAADSRLWGGIHFRSDNAEGLKLGKSVAADMRASADQLDAALELAG